MSVDLVLIFHFSLLTAWLYLNRLISFILTARGIYLKTLPYMLPGVAAGTHCPFLNMNGLNYRMADLYTNYLVVKELVLMSKLVKWDFVIKAGPLPLSFPPLIPAFIWQLTRPNPMHQHFRYFAILQLAGSMINFMFRLQESKKI